MMVRSTKLVVYKKACLFTFSLKLDLESKVARHLVSTKTIRLLVLVFYELNSHLIDLLKNRTRSVRLSNRTLKA